MRILILSTNGLKYDGITSWILQTFELMDKTGIEVATVAWNGTDINILEKANSVGLTVYSVSSRKRDTRSYLRELSDVISKGQFDVVHVCGNSATMALELMIAKLHRVTRRVAHISNTTCDHKVVDRLLRPVFYRLTTHSFACGEEAGRFMFGHREFTVIQNGKDPNVYHFDPALRDSLRTRFGFGENEIVIGHVGAFNRQKNHKFLLDVFQECQKEIPNSKLVMVGDGPLRSDMEDYAKKLGVAKSAVFLGYRGDVPDLLQMMDCMLLPSLFEGLPNVVIEWQYCGLPSVVSDSITQECAITSLVKRVSLNGSPEIWVSEIKRCLLNSNRECDAQSAREQLDSAGFNMSKVASTLREFYLHG